MLISEFARETGLTTDTVRFYIRKGLLTPTTNGGAGSTTLTYSVMKNASATTGNARPTHAASVHPPSAYAQPPSAEPTAPPTKKAAT
jgi:hypothetical protein